MNLKMLMNSERTEGVRKVPAADIEKWGHNHGVILPQDFVDFFQTLVGFIRTKNGDISIFRKMKTILNSQQLGIFCISTIILAAIQSMKNTTTIF